MIKPAINIVLETRGTPLKIASFEKAINKLARDYRNRIKFVSN